MRRTKEELARYTDMAALVVGLPLATAHRDGVIDNLARLLEFADQVMDFPLPEDIEPAPVFRP